MYEYPCSCFFANSTTPADTTVIDLSSCAWSMAFALSAFVLYHTFNSFCDFFN